MDMKAWAFGQFDMEAPFVTGDLLKILAETHAEHSRAQSEVNTDSERVYGSVNLELQSRVRAACQKRAFHTVLVKKGTPRVPVINGKLVLFWRFGKTGQIDAEMKRYATSEYRGLSFFVRPSVEKQFTLFEVEQPQDDLSDEDRELLTEIRKLSKISEADDEFLPVVMIAYASSSAGIHKIFGADASLKDDGCLELSSLCDLSAALMTTESQPGTKKTFDRAPKRIPALKPKVVNDEEKS